MGQQVQFETLDTVARAVEATAKASETLTERDMTVSLHSNDGKLLGRAELKLTEANGDTVEAHFYEAYWAPLTEGKITLRQTLAFLRDAGTRGLRFAYREGVFDRWMFEKRHEFQIPAERVLHLGLALWILFLLGVAFSALALVPILKFVDLLRDIATSEFAFAAALSYAVALSVLFAVALALPVAWLLRSRRPEPPPAVNQPCGFLAPSLWARSLMVLATAVVVGLSSWLTWLVGSRMYFGWLQPLTADPMSHIWRLFLAGVAFVAEFVALRMFAERFLVQFVGDVAAYISPFKVSTFEELRHEIQDRARTVAKFIYESRSAGSTKLLYHRVFFVGHSLGSVIAYDAFNDAINRDAIPNGWTPGSAQNAYEVVNRTRLLLTFGSPLDKTAFIFRTQRTNAEVDLREALATMMQPLIVDYANRRGRWINLWAPSDWISGRLTYYDSPNRPPDADVCNLRNKGAVRPWYAHTRYWTDPLFSGVLYSALTGKPARTLPPDQQKEVLNAVSRARQPVVV
jgi:hypothetical protein